jgi:hypothetical protein
MRWSWWAPPKSSNRLQSARERNAEICGWWQERRINLPLKRKKKREGKQSKKEISILLAILEALPRSSPYLRDIPGRLFMKIWLNYSRRSVEEAVHSPRRVNFWFKKRNNKESLAGILKKFRNYQYFLRRILLNSSWAPSELHPREHTWRAVARSRHKMKVQGKATSSCKAEQVCSSRTTTCPKR